MFVQSFLIVGIAIIGVCMILIILILLYLYLRVNRELSSVDQEFTQYKNEREESAHKALLAAEQKAQQIINETKVFTDEIKTSLQNTISKSINEGTSTYASLLSDIKNKTAGQILQIEKTLENQTASEVKEMALAADKESKEIGLNLRKISEEKQHEYLKEMEEQKQKDIQELKNKVMSLLPEVMKETISKSLSREDQERIALESINKIKSKYGI